MYVHKEISLVRFNFRTPYVDLGLDIEGIDIFINMAIKDSQLLNGGVPWRGAKEKDALSLQMFVESIGKTWSCDS